MAIISALNINSLCLVGFVPSYEVLDRGGHESLDRFAGATTIANFRRRELAEVRRKIQIKNPVTRDDRFALDEQPDAIEPGSRAGSYYEAAPGKQILEGFDSAT